MSTPTRTYQRMTSSWVREGMGAFEIANHPVSTCIYLQDYESLNLQIEHMSHLCWKRKCFQTCWGDLNFRWNNWEILFSFRRLRIQPCQSSMLASAKAWPLRPVGRTHEKLTWWVSQPLNMGQKWTQLATACLCFEMFSLKLDFNFEKSECLFTHF